METNSENPVISRQVIEMITVAHEYCLFIEKSEKHTSSEIFTFIQKIGPLLYLKGAMLPDDIEADPQYAERHVTEEQWEEVFKNLRNIFKDKDLYFALDENADSHQYSLADNLSDIYQDMKDFVMLYQKAPMQSKACAVAELQKLYENHWGLILLKALHAVHLVQYNDSLSEGTTIDWDDLE
jgi:hypothetical protein